MKHLADINNYQCSLYMVKNQQTNKTEIVVKFANFETDEEALEFAELFQLQSSINDIEQSTVH